MRLVGKSSSILLYKFLCIHEALVFNHGPYTDKVITWWPQWLDFNGDINDWGKLSVRIADMGWLK